MFMAANQENNTLLAEFEEARSGKGPCKASG